MVKHDHDEAEFSLVVTRPTTKSSSSAEHDDDRLSPLLANLSIGYTLVETMVHRIGLPPDVQLRREDFIVGPATTKEDSALS
jgi:hypothetical protein